MNIDRPLTIGRLAQKAGIHVETVRYYQKRGLIKVPEKPLQGYRIYPDTTLAQLSFIQRAKQAGFTLSEIANLLVMDEDCHCHQAQQIAQNKLGIVNKKIMELMQIKNTLETFVADCQNNSPEDKCGIIESFKKKP